MMNKKLSLSKFTIAMLAIMVIALVYCFVYLIPVQDELNTLRMDLSVAKAEAGVYSEHINDTSALLADIDAAQQEIAELHANGYINDSNVSFVIGDAIQRYHVSLTSVNLEKVTKFEGYRVLPVKLVMTGELDNVLDFISFFENDDEGSYMVRGTSFEMANNTVKASIVIFLCTPDM